MTVAKSLLDRRGFLAKAVPACALTCGAMNTAPAVFAAQQTSGQPAAAGKTRFGGQIPINVSGGLKARGHPVGATGVYQIVEAVQQLRGEAAPTQVEQPVIGMAQNIGGSGATIITHILKSL